MTIKPTMSASVKSQTVADTCMNFSLDSHEYNMVKVSLTDISASAPGFYTVMTR